MFAFDPRPTALDNPGFAVDVVEPFGLAVTYGLDIPDRDTNDIHFSHIIIIYQVG